MTKLERVISLSASPCALLSARQARQTTPPLLAFVVAMLLAIPFCRHFSEFAVKEDMLCMLYYVLDNVYTLAWLTYADYSHQIWSTYANSLKWEEEEIGLEIESTRWSKSFFLLLYTLVRLNLLTPPYSRTMWATSGSFWIIVSREEIGLEK
ncbi:hypothetical protein LXL04_006168 [Taraxacum kok-saghyz]